MNILGGGRVEACFNDVVSSFKGGVPKSRTTTGESILDSSPPIWMMSGGTTASVFGESCCDSTLRSEGASDITGGLLYVGFATNCSSISKEETYGQLWTTILSLFQSCNILDSELSCVPLAPSWCAACSSASAATSGLDCDDSSP